MTLKLLRYRVTDFRSVKDSGWIEVDEVTALIGVNESGKTNLLLPLWKLNPAKEGTIDLMADSPRKIYGDIHGLDTKPVFIRAEFEVPSDLAAKIGALAKCLPQSVSKVVISRRLDGGYLFSFPEWRKVEGPARDEVLKKITSLIETFTETTDIAKLETGFKEDSLERLHDLLQRLEQSNNDHLGADELEAFISDLDELDADAAGKRPVLVPRLLSFLDELRAALDDSNRPGPSATTGVWHLVKAEMPKFVYYSNYGNLDSEIYLPHVIENMDREGIGSKELAKTRTLKVLFDFVRLSPEEILELGKAATSRGPGYSPSEQEIQDAAERTKQREILLQSASSKLTSEFKDWWKQGEYRFHLQADGDHFRIWVSDDQRPEEVELENRSTGLQWFLSFYLIFLVESGEAHSESVLLLDEPGLSLHPLAQKDLFLFFENLSTTNQIIYTTHSPFMVNANHLDQVRSVYVDESGQTVASSDLRVNPRIKNQTTSIYAAHAALGLTASVTMIDGSDPVIVEGVSDQIFLSAIRDTLVREGKIKPSREMIFMPAGGVKGVKPILALLGATHDDFPHVLFDSDKAGKEMKASLISNLYQGLEPLVHETDDYCKLPGSEIEDLIPAELMADVISQLLRGPDIQEFSEVHMPTGPIVPQVEQYADSNGLDLPKGWKVETAKRVKQRLLRRNRRFDPDEETLKLWKRLFTDLNKE